MSQELLRVKVQASRQEIGALDMAQLLYLLVEVRPPDQFSQTPPLLNICLLIDRSTSMRGDRLERVKAAAALIIERMAPNDVVSVVTFSDRAEVVLPASRLNNKAALVGRIKAISASGGTEIYQGLAAGVQELRKAASPKRISQLILLTDGHTYGDADACLNLAEKTVAEGIGINAYGIGAEWNDQFLDRLVAPSGGQSGFIESPAQIVDFLRECIDGLGNTYAQNLRLKVEFPVGVRLRYGFKVTPFAQPLEVDPQEIKLGVLESHLPLSVLLEVAVEPQLPDKVLVLPFQLLGDVPVQQATNHAVKCHLAVRVIADQPEDDVPEEIITAVRALNFYRMNEQVWQEVEGGELEVATMRLRRLTTRLLEAGHTKLAQQAYAETERLSRIGTLSLEGRKKLKYGTRSLLTQSFHLDES